MHMKGSKVFTGMMRICNGWEIRPFAVQIAEGAYSPGLSAREHRVGNSTVRFITLEPKCVSREEAFEVAMAHSRQLACVG